MSVFLRKKIFLWILHNSVFLLLLPAKRFFRQLFSICFKQEIFCISHDKLIYLVKKSDALRFLLPMQNVENHLLLYWLHVLQAQHKFTSSRRKKTFRINFLSDFCIVLNSLRSASLFNFWNNASLMALIYRYFLFLVLRIVYQHPSHCWIRMRSVFHSVCQITLSLSCKIRTDSGGFPLPWIP